MRREQSDWPERLGHREDAVGRIMRKYVHRPDGNEDDSFAYARTRATMRRRHTRHLVFSLTIAAVGATGVSLFAFLGPEPALVTAPKVDLPPRASSLAPMAVPPSTTRPAPGAVTTRRSIRLGFRSMRLPEGETDLPGEATMTVSSATGATGRVHDGASAIALAAGQVDLHVQPRPPGRSFVVTAGSFRFVVVGTAFSVRRQGPAVFLEVREGKVAVMRDRRQIAMITAGGSWTGLTGSSVPLAQTAARCPAGVGPDAAREAITCLERQAATGSGPQNEASAYEAARLWKDEVRDLEQARVAFRAYQRRFPRGALQLETSLSLLELLPRLGRHQEALAESARLLADRAAAARWSEIQAIRGNIFREGLGDAAAAAAEVRAEKQRGVQTP